MTNGYDLSKAMITALLSDTVFTNYCTSALGTVPTFLVGMDSNNPPTDDNIPFVAIVPATEQDNDNQYIEHAINIGAVITSDTVTEVTATKTITFDGYDTILDFSSELLKGIKRAMIASEISTASSTMSMLSYTPARIEFYRPQYHSTREITLTTSY